MREGTDLLIVASGAIACQAVAAADALAAEGAGCSVLVVSSLNPPPAADLADALGRFGVALTVESHYVTGGLGSLVAEVIAENGIGCRLVRCGVDRSPDGRTGSERWMHAQSGLSVEGLVASARGALAGACLTG